jgi:hypothetical protein
MLKYSFLKYFGNLPSLIFVKPGGYCGDLKIEFVPLLLSEISIGCQFHLKHALDSVQWIHWHERLRMQVLSVLMDESHKVRDTL